METLSDTPPPPAAPRPSEPREPSARGLGARLFPWLKTSPALHAAVIVVLLLGLGVLAVWRSVEIARLDRRVADEHAQLLRTSAEILTHQTSALLRLSALPLGWAMRSALLKDDLASIDAYLQRMVQEPQVTSAALVAPDGKVLLAGNRNLVGRLAVEVFPGVSLAAQSPTLVESEHDLRVVVPVMGYDRRLGTLVFGYRRPTEKALSTAAASSP